MDAGITVEVGNAALMSPQFLEPGIAAIGIALYVAAFFVLSMILFRLQDLYA